MRLRILAAALATILAAVGLTACQTAAGAAVTIDGQRYTENDVQGYLTPAAQPVPLSQTQLSPKAFVVDQLIVDRLLVKVVGLVPNGPSPSAIDAELTKEGRGQSNTSRAEALGLKGYTDSFYKIVLRVQLLQNALQQMQQAGVNLSALVKGLSFPVALSARYGTWDPKSFAFDGTPAVPSYLKLQPGQV